MIRAIPFVLLAHTAQADGLRFPSNAEMLAEETLNNAQYALPTGAWNGTIPTIPVEGAMVQQAWRIDAAGLSTLQLLRPLREQLLNNGFDVIFECATDICGGFDFRFETPTLRPPALHINLADFRFLSAWKTDGDTEQAVSLFVSQTGTAGYVQVTTIGADVAQVVRAEGAPARATTLPTDGSIAASLDNQGFAVLAGLTFETGSSQLSAEESPP